MKPMRTTNGGSGGIVICLGVGGLVDLSEILCLSNAEEEEEEEDMGGVEVWVFDARRPWNLANVFGGEGQPAVGEMNATARRKMRGVEKGCITSGYTSGNGGIVVYDDGDIEEELGKERDAYCELLAMPEVDEEEEDDADDSESDREVDHLSSSDSKKRKSWSRQDDDDESDDEDGPPRQRRRSDSVGLV